MKDHGKVKTSCQPIWFFLFFSKTNQREEPINGLPCIDRGFSGHDNDGYNEKPKHRCNRDASEGYEALTYFNERIGEYRKSSHYIKQNTGILTRSSNYFYPVTAQLYIQCLNVDVHLVLWISRRNPICHSYNRFYQIVSKCSISFEDFE